jgi:hypothetical protein
MEESDEHSLPTVRQIDVACARGDIPAIHDHVLAEQA